MTVYGDTFEPVHDALQITLTRNINDDNYVSNMKEMVMRQVKDSALATRLSKMVQTLHCLRMLHRAIQDIYLKVLNWQIKWIQIR